MSEFLFSQMWTSRAEAGDPVAQFNLAYCYDMGQGTPVNLDAAAKWYLRAAIQGHARAQYHLGLACSFGGSGLEWDLTEACKWLTLASRNGIAEAVDALRALKAKPEDRALGERLAREFTPVPEPRQPISIPAEAGLQQTFVNPNQLDLNF
jgi:TPR repeat protein